MALGPKPGCAADGAAAVDDVLDTRVGFASAWVGIWLTLGSRGTDQSVFMRNDALPAAVDMVPEEEEYGHLWRGAESRGAVLCIGHSSMDHTELFRSWGIVLHQIEFWAGTVAGKQPQDCESEPVRGGRATPHG